MMQQRREAENQPAMWESSHYVFEVNFCPSAARQKLLRPELIKILHETFIDHPDYDAEHVPEFLQSDIYIRVFAGDELAGIFTADLFRTEGVPVLYLSVGLVSENGRSGGTVMLLSMGVTLSLASQAFGTDVFFVALRTANPRVVAKLWQNPWVRFYPRRDWYASEPRLTTLVSFRQGCAAQNFQLPRERANRSRHGARVRWSQAWARERHGLDTQVIGCRSSDESAGWRSDGYPDPSL